MEKVIEIILVEDNHRFAKSLQSMLELNRDMNCAAHFSSAQCCLEAFQKHSYASMPVDIVLLDLHLPDGNGLSLIPALQKHHKELKILVITQDNDYHTTLEAIRLGVYGYILKSSPIHDIEHSIREVSDGGGCVIDPQLSRLVLNTLSPSYELKDNPLSKREVEVLERLAMGYVKKEVAAQLSISYRTVAEHTENIYKKLQVPNVAAAIAKAIRKGFI